MLDFRLESSSDWRIETVTDKNSTFFPWSKDSQPSSIKLTKSSRNVCVLLLVFVGDYGVVEARLGYHHFSGKPYSPGQGRSWCFAWLETIFQKLLHYHRIKTSTFEVEKSAFNSKTLPPKMVLGRIRCCTKTRNHIDAVWNFGRNGCFRKNWVGSTEGRLTWATLSRDTDPVYRFDRAGVQYVQGGSAVAFQPSLVDGVTKGDQKASGV